MIDVLVHILGALFIPRREREFPRERLPSSPDAKLKMPVVKRAYERWAKERAFEWDDRGYRGMLGDKLIRIRTGLEGSAPISVEIEVHAEHGAPTALVTAGNVAADAPPAIRRVAQALFEHPEYVLPIRSIAFAPRIIRIRMAALTAPEGVARVLEWFDEAELFAKPRAITTPYRD